jgi:hypothetical protein
MNRATHNQVETIWITQSQMMKNFEILQLVVVVVVMNSKMKIHQINMTIVRINL